MPHKHIFEIHPADAAKTRLRIESGNHLHGLLFSLLAQKTPEMADTLHAAKEKPFSLWPLLKADGGITLLVSSLSDELAAALDIMAKNKGNAARLGTQPVIVSVRKKASKPIDKMWLDAENVEKIDLLRLNFLSPASFRRSGKQWLYPDPAIVFQNVYTRAVDAYGDFFRDNLTPPTEYADSFMVSRYELSTRQIDYGRYKIIGFCGYCVYDCRRMTLVHTCRSLAFLSRLAEFTGIGYKTTMGMGWTESLLGSER